MRALLVVIGVAFVAAAVLLLGTYVSGEMSPYIGRWKWSWLRPWLYVGTPLVIAAFFFRWAWNMGRSYDGR